MSDLSLTMGGDLPISASGDIGVSIGAQLGQDRVLRRLLTSPGAYIWHLDYGAGLAQFIGQPTNGPAIQGVVVTQMGLETAVQQTPAPTVSVALGQGGTVTLSVTYVDADTGTTQVVSLPPG
jgi:hypothetical protein